MSDDNGMSLYAVLDKQSINSKEIRYEKPSRESPGARKYDACHYQILFNESLLDDYYDP